MISVFVGCVCRKAHFYLVPPGCNYAENAWHLDLDRCYLVCLLLTYCRVQSGILGPDQSFKRHNFHPRRPSCCPFLSVVFFRNPYYPLLVFMRYSRAIQQWLWANGSCTAFSICTACIACTWPSLGEELSTSFGLPDWLEMLGASSLERGMCLYMSLHIA